MGTVNKYSDLWHQGGRNSLLFVSNLIFASFSFIIFAAAVRFGFLKENWSDLSMPLVISGVCVVAGIAFFFMQSKQAKSHVAEVASFNESITSGYGLVLAPGENVDMGDPGLFVEGEAIRIIRAFRGDKTLTDLAVFIENGESVFYSTDGQKLKPLSVN